jgi:hypothetical protein
MYLHFYTIFQTRREPSLFVLLPKIRFKRHPYGVWTLSGC